MNKIDNLVRENQQSQPPLFMLSRPTMNLQSSQEPTTLARMDTSACSCSGGAARASHDQACVVAERPSYWDIYRPCRSYAACTAAPLAS
jgi:hypothetical protein